MKTDCVLLLSGGLDSLVLLARECHADRWPHCVSFDYGQRHRRHELDAATRIAKHYGVFHRVERVPALLGSALTGQEEIPKGLHYENPGQKVTVVPNRNAVLISLAASVAAARGLKRVLFAAHAGDAAVYPDTRAGFVRAIDEAMVLACGVNVEAPFVTRTKRDIVLLGREVNAPLDLAWSCYDPQGPDPCGQCGACLELHEAMA